MRIFISAGEPSGDIHAANLARELQSRRPDVEIVGFGGPHLAEAGGKLLYPLTELAVMFFTRVLAHIVSFLNLLSRADRYFRHHKPDAVVLIDFPGFNWWIARRAKAHGIPVFYFVPPQLWGWAGWRVKKMQRFVDHILCSLPFEPAWYAERGVKADYIGHPFFDEVPAQKLNEAFLDQQRADGRPIVAILPGSRNQEIERNLSTQVRAARLIQDARPDVKFLVACYRPHQKKKVDEYLTRYADLAIETFTGRTPEIIELARATISVSGSVSLELLHRLSPTVIVYRLTTMQSRLAPWFLKAKYITLVNLLADQMLYPEYMSTRNESVAVSKEVLKWLNDDNQRQALVDALAKLKERFATPGACSRAAEFILDKLVLRKAA